jgi:hypothetical protein
VRRDYEDVSFAASEIQGATVQLGIVGRAESLVENYLNVRSLRVSA